MAKELAARFAVLLDVIDNKSFRELLSLFVAHFWLSAVPAVFAYRSESALSTSATFGLAIELSRRFGDLALAATFCDLCFNLFHAVNYRERWPGFAVFQILRQPF
jgi:hypothetical protein